MSKPWCTVVDAKQVWAPQQRINQYGEEYTKMVLVGHQITMADGSWWFRSPPRAERKRINGQPPAPAQPAKWTQHFPEVEKTDYLGGQHRDHMGRPITEGKTYVDKKTGMLMREEATPGAQEKHQKHTWTWAELMKEFGGRCPELITALVTGYADAETREPGE